MTVYLTDPDFVLHQGDALEVLRGLPDASVDCCVTSPPYWGLRDYSAAGQMGLEPTPAAYVTAMVAVFAEVRRVLADHGTCWLNIGDSYATGGNGVTVTETDREAAARRKIGYQADSRSTGQHGGWENRASQGKGTAVGGLKPKDLCGIPWRLAFALQQDGWWLRSDIIWSKPNPMPESVTDRPTKSHEYVFLLSKRPSYFFDQEAVREPAEWARWGDQTYSPEAEKVYGQRIKPRRKSDIEKINGRNVQATNSEAERRDEVGGSFNNNPRLRENVGRNVRSVWEIATQPYAEAHFATFPEELARRAIAAGCPDWVCGVCGRPRERLVERTVIANGDGRKHIAGGDKTVGVGWEGVPRASLETETVGWSDCGHHAYRAGVTLDPFMGSGTVALVARKLGRRSVGIELNPDYCALAARRLQQLSLLADEATA